MNILKKPKQPPFYIGWMPKAPAYRNFVRLLIFTLFVVCFFVASFLISNQQGFSSGIFERTEFTELKGLLVQHPFPAIKTFYGKDIYGNPVVKTIPLVNKGKFGADSIVAQLVRENKPGNLWASVRGKLIYNNGYVIMELTEEKNAIHHAEEMSEDQKEKISAPVIQVLDSVVLYGQIVDPKCYLGVMKPGEGKPHSDCAIRCISGGIPPVFMIRNNQGFETLFLLQGKDNESINQEVLKYVGLPVSVSGVVEKVDDWLILKVDPISGINMSE